MMDIRSQADHPCHNHTLYFCNPTLKFYNGLPWICQLCESSSRSIFYEEFSWHCPECQFDICEDCFDKFCEVQEEGRGHDGELIVEPDCLINAPFHDYLKIKLELGIHGITEININSCKNKNLREVLLSLVYFGNLKKLYNEYKSEEDKVVLVSEICH